MKKSISVLAVFALSHLTFLGQTNLQTLFEKKLDYNTNLFKGNIYLCDSVIYSDYLNDETVKDLMYPQDTAAAKIIIKKGELIKKDFFEIFRLFPSCIKRISFYDFESIESLAAEIKDVEVRPIQMLDSLNFLSQKIGASDITLLSSINKQLELLYKDKNVINYFDRVDYATKRLILIHQAYTYNNQILLFFTIFKSMTNRFDVVIIIPNQSLLCQ